MKTKFYLSILILSGLNLIACNNTPQSENDAISESEQVEDYALIPETESATVEWTAFKTTEKVPVKGWFTEIEITDIRSGNSLEEVLDGVQFTLNSFELETNDTARDETIRKNFFEQMMEPGTVKGKFNSDGNGWTVDLRMNGVNVIVPAEISLENNTAELIATLDLNEFKALKALKTLHDACYDLHMGGDGVSKTWDVVEVKATLSFKE